MEYKLIQDLFVNHLIEDIRDNLTLKDINGDPITRQDQNGNIVVNAKDEPISLAKLWFGCSTWNEFTNVVLEAIPEADKFPFIFMPSGENISYSQKTREDVQNVTVKELYLCTLSDKDLSADERDLLSFNGILIPLKEKIEERMAICKNLDMPINFGGFAFQQYHAYSTTSQTFEERLDIIVLQNLQFGMKANCQK